MRWIMIAVVITGILLSSSGSAGVAVPVTAVHPPVYDLMLPGAPAVTADAAAVIDATTGVLLYGKNAYVRRPPASLTKIMTVLVALERADPLDVVTVSVRAARTGGASMELRSGEQWLLGELLFGAMLESGNDAAAAIAEHISGSEMEFSRLMTERAWAAGALKTTFANPQGFTSPDHMSTAYDMCLIGRAAARVPLIARMAITSELLATEQTTGRTILLKSTNRLLYEEPAATGMKTGTTPSAGRCLMFSARRGNREIIGVVLHSSDRYGDARKLIDYCLREYEIRMVAAASDPIITVDVVRGDRSVVAVRPAEDVYYPIQSEGELQLRYVVDVERQLVAPLAAGTPVGTLTVSGDGGTVTVQLVTAHVVSSRPIVSWWRW